MQLSDLHQECGKGMLKISEFIEVGRSEETCQYVSLKGVFFLQQHPFRVCVFMKRSTETELRFLL